jgi:hypothetical protein
VVQGGKPVTFTFRLDGYQPLVQTLAVPAGEKGRPVGGTLLPGAGLSVSVTLADAKVSVEGVPACQNRKAPMIDCPVAPGSYTVRVTSQSPSYVEERRVEVDKTDVKLEFEVGFVEAAATELLKAPNGRAVRRLALREGRQTVTVIGVDKQERQVQVQVAAGGTVRVPLP